MRKLFLLFLFMGFSLVAFAQETSCSDGVDNDGDGFIDCFDSDCGGNAVCDGTYTGNDADCEIPQPPGSDFSMVLENETNEHVASTHGRFVIGDMGDPVNGKDGIPEVVTAHTSQRKIYILDGQTLDIKYEATSPNRIDRYDIAIGDVRNNGCAQIFVAEEGTERVCVRFRSNGTCREYDDVPVHWISSWDCEANFLWRTKVYGRPFTLGLADFDSDGMAELYFRNQILDAATGVVQVGGSGDWSKIDGGPVAVDILDDAACADCAGLELVAGGEIYSVNLNAQGALDSGSLTLVRRFNDIPGLPASSRWNTKFLDLDNDEFVNSQTSIADFDLDGKLDVLMTGTSDGGKTTIFYWNIVTGAYDVYRPPNNWQYGAGRLNLADLDGDGQMNVAFVSGGYLYALDENLDLMWRIAIDEFTSGYTSTTVFDFNNDGASEIVYRDERYLYIIKGDGTFSPPIQCKSLTSNEYPIVADVDADGSTEICVICQDDFNDSNFAGMNEGVIRTYKSGNEPWVSARKVWNQHGYFNVNVNDDLTIPIVQQKHHVVFSADQCGPGENRVLNSFLNQSAILNTDGCKTYPSADIAFLANPNLLNIAPPTCPDQDFLVSITLRNIGSLDVTADIPITFYSGDPQAAGAVKLGTHIITVANFKKGDQLDVPNIAVAGTGGPFTLFAVLNDDGSTVPTPIILPNSGIDECNLGNNIASASVTPQAFQITTSFTDHVQCGAGPSPPNGSVKAFKLEGAVEQTVGYTFYWFDGTTAGPSGSADHIGSEITGLTAGTYTVYATHDAYQCGSDTVQVTVGQQALSIGATVNVDKPYTNCNSPDGQLSVTPDSGNINDYTYEWFEGTVFGTSPTLSDSSVLRFTKALTYSVLVTQISSGCETLESGTVPDLTVTPAVTTSFTAANCAPPNSGEASANVGGVTAGYTFYWYDGSTSKPSEDFLGDTYSNITAGNYTVIAEDNTTGCSSIETVATVPTVSGITVSANITAQQTSCATPNGAASANVGGTTAGYSFRWFQGNNTINEIGTSPVITGLAAGDYTVEATHGVTGCTDTELITIVDNILIPTVTPSVVAHQVDCLPPDGVVSATAAGSPGPYNFYWFDGNIGTPDTTAADFEGASYTGLTAGFYTVVAVDANTRCAAPRGLVQVLDQTVNPVINSSAVSQTSCDPANPNGQASADVGGATAPYKFRWFTGSDTTNFIIQNPVLSNRAAGTYTVKAVTRATGCFTTKLIVINDISAKPTLSLVKQDNTVCSATIGYTGSVTASFATNPNAQGGHTYTYEWKKDGVVIAGETDASVTGLNAGTYEVTVRNNNLGCTSDPISVVVNDVVALPVITTTSTASTNCVPGLENGSASVATVDGLAPGGTSDYTYQWHTGAGTGSPIAVGSNPSADDAVLTGVQGGAGFDYTVLVTNLLTGCTNTAIVNVADAKALPELSLVATDNSICDPTLTSPPVQFNGTVTTSVTNMVGALTDYTFVFGGGAGTQGTSPAHNTFNQLNGGITYDVTTTHALTGCVSAPTTIQVLNNQDTPDLTTSSDGSTNCVAGLEDGQARVETVDTNPATTAGFSFSWTGPAGFSVAANSTNDDIELDNVQGGAGFDYTVLVTNLSNGCQNTAIVNVADEKILPALSLVATDNSICDPTLTSPSVQFDGTVTASVTNMVGALTDYTFAFGGGAGTQGTSPAHNTFTQLNGGITYDATTTHTLTGCASALATIQVLNNQDTPDLTTSSDGSTNCVAGLEDGQARVETVDTNPATTAGFTFAWTGLAAFSVAANPTNADIELDNIQGGAGFDYTVLVTNLSNGCQNTAVVNVADEKILPSLNLVATDNSICDPTLTSPSVPFNGTVTASVTNMVGALTDYTFVFGGGAGTQGTSPAHNTFNQLNGGITYNATSTHTLTGCVSAPATIQVLNNQDTPDLTISSDGSTNCVAGLEDGQARVETVDTNPATTTGFSFAWSGALFDVSANATNDDVQLENIQGGAGQNYTVLVTNLSNGCQNTAVVNVTDERVLPSISLTPVENTICDPTLTSPVVQFNGSVTATVTNILGALTDYTFAFGGGAGTPGPSPTHNTFNNLNGGITYDATATHTVTGCPSNVATAFVTNDLTYPVLLTSADASMNCDPALANGAAHVTDVDAFTIGTDPEALSDYTYQWYNGNTVVAGNLRPGDVNPTVGSTTPGSGLQGGAASTFTVLVTAKADGCQSNTSVTIADAKADPVISVSLAKNNTICDSGIGADGSLTAAVTYKGVLQGSPLTANWEVTWSNAFLGETVTGLFAGNYSATVTDTNTGCTSSPDNGTIVDQFDIPVIMTTVLNHQTSCDPADPNGQLSGSATNGPVGSTLRFTWHPGIGTAGAAIATANGQASGSSLSTAADLVANDYTFLARNEVTGCENTSTTSIAQQLSYPAFTGAVTDVTSCDPTNGAVDINFTTITDPNQFTIYYLNENNFAQTGDPATVKSSATLVSSNPTDLTYTGVVPTHDLIPGTYTVLLRDEVSHCESNPETFTVDDNTVKTVTATIAASATACNNNDGGLLNLTVNPPLVLPATYTYQWYRGVASNSNFNFMNDANLPVFPAGTALQTSEDLTGEVDGDFSGVSNGIYTVVVIDPVGCGKVFSETVPFIGAPTVTVTTTNSSKCDPALSDAQIDVQVVGSIGITYSVNLYKSHISSPGNWINGEDDGCDDLVDNDGDGLIDIADPDCGVQNANTTFTNTSALLTGMPSEQLLGDYLIRVFDPAGGVGCVTEKVVTLETDPKLPQVTTALTASTVCAGGTGDGTVQITVNKDPLDPTTPTYQLSVINPMNIGGATPQALPTGIATMVTGTFNAQAYTLTVEDVVSGCEVDKTVNIPSQPAVPTAFVVTPTHDELCAPATNGSALVTTLTGPGAMTDYTFGWYLENTLTTPVTPVVAGGGPGGEVLTSGEVIATNPAFWPINATNGLGNGNKTFYVRAQKQGGVGDKCFTPITQVAINDIHAAPNLNLTPFSNTSCSAANPEGRIEITASTTTPNGNAAIDGSTYTYSWAPVTPGTPDNNVDGSTPYLLSGLDDNTYTVTAVNEINGCIVQNSATVLDTKFDIEITDRLAQDQDMCPNDGQIDVTEIQIDRTITGEATLTYNGVDLSNEFTYQWFKAPTATPGTFNITSPLEDNAANDIDVLSLVSGTAPTEYPAMGFGTYYVIATRTNSATIPGALCSSQPLRVDVADKRVFPIVSFATVSPTACDDNHDGRIAVTANTASGPGAGSNYNFVWTNDPDGLGGPLFSASNSATNNTASPFSTLATDKVGEGSYSIRVTNFATQCFTDGTVAVAKQTVPMEIVSVTPTHVDVCSIPQNGAGTVTAVNVSGGPGNTADFTYTWADNAAMAAPFVANNAALTQGPLDIGIYYVIARRNAVVSPATPGVTGSGCVTSPVPFTVLDRRVYPTVSFATVSPTACDDNHDGRITVTANTASGPGAASNYNFVWTNDPDGLGGPLFSASNSATNNTASPFATLATDKIGEGSYSIRVTNFTTQCFTDGTVAVTKQTVPTEIVSVTPTHVDVCLPTPVNGAGTVTAVNVSGGAGNTADFTYTWDNDQLMGSPFVTNNPALTQGGLDIGTYYVIARRNAVVSPATPGITGSGCVTSPVPFTVLDRRVYPTVSFATVSPTACDDNHDGRITVTASTASGPGAASNYNFVWTNDPDGLGGPLFSASNSATNNTASPFATLSTDKIGEGSYGIRVTNFATQCFTDGTVSVTKQTVPMEIVSVTPTHVDVCSLPQNGAGTVTAVNVSGAPGNTADFTYTWADNAAMAAPFITNNAALTQGPLDIGTYYVIARRNGVVSPATPGVSGSGCATSPVPFTVLDQRVYPTISFATVSTTACDGAHDGRITVTANTASGPGAGSNYDFVWTNDPDGLGGAAYSASNSPTNNTASPFSTLPSDLVGEGSYSIRVTNFTTQCFTDGTVSLQKNSVPIEILTATASPQQLCTVPGDGSVAVALGDVRVGGNPVGAGITFGWVDSNGNAVGAGSSVSNLNAGFYTVQATRTSGMTPASGCVSAPLQVEVEDQREYPVVTFSTVANTTCNNNFDAAITLTATTVGLGNGANYDIDWTGPGAPAVITDVFNMASPYTTQAPDNIGVGTYTVTVTNVVTQCPSDASVSVLQNTTPVQIWDVTKVDQTDCAPFNGSITIDTNDPAHVSVSGPYTFSWEDDGAPVVPAPVPDDVLSGVDAGVYTITGTKSSGVGAGCVTAPLSVTLLDLTDRPVLELQSMANFACDPAMANGQISAVIFEGTSAAPATDYNLQWFAGKNVTSGPVVGSSDVLMNQPEGDYTLVAVDNVSPNRGCDNSATLAIDFDETSFSVSVAAADQNLCAPGQNGSVTVSGITEVRNGVSTPAANLALYDYQWFDETGTPHPSTPAFTNGVTSINNVLAGDYLVQVRNALGCISTESASLVNDLTVLPAITLDNFLNPAVCILPETAGYLQVSADNSLNFSDYTFEWFEGPDDTGTLVEPNNATLGNIQYNQPLQYTVRVTNIATNCVNLDTYRFRVDTVQIQVLASAVGRTNCLVDDGSLFATTLNGTGALYNYEWYAGPTPTGVPVYTTKQVAGAPIGQYTVIAINPNHAFCNSTPYTTRVTDKRVLPPVVAVQRNPLTYCDPANPNGVAYASVNNGVVGFRFDWFQGSVGGAAIYTGPEVKNLTATTYVVRATDVLTGCEQTASIVIENDPVNVAEPTVVVVSHLTNCEVADGILSASVDGNTSNYLLQWYDGNSVKSQSDETGEFYRDLEEGSYTTTATHNESGCISDPVVTEVLPFQEIPEFDIATVPTNCEQDIGEAWIELLNDVQLSSIEWDINGIRELGARVSSLPKGEFTVTVTTYKQCADSKTFIVEPEVLVFNGVSRNNDGQNDIFEIACIQDFPQNNVKIFNRAGTLVYEANGYDNQDVFFDGISNRGINLLGTDLPDGTYFYIIDKRNGTKPRTGYLELLR